FEDKPGDLEALLKNPRWRFSHNWREVEPEEAKDADPNGSWIPACSDDRLLEHVEAGSRKRGDANFLRPARDSPLATGGAGGDAVSPLRITSAAGQAQGLSNPWMAAWAVAWVRNRPDRSLPAYVGAVPPDKVEPWDWDTTWKELAR